MSVEPRESHNEAPPLKPYAVNIDTAMVLLGNKSRAKVYDCINDGSLDAVRDGPRKTLITMESIERYWANLPKAKLRSLEPAVKARMEQHRKRTNKRSRRRSGGSNA